MTATVGFVFAVAMFVSLRPAGRGEGGSAAGADRAGARQARGVRRAIGPGQREVDSASVRVRGRVVDPDGQPVEGGALILSCLEGEPPGRLLDRPLTVGADGIFAGPGCPGETCAQFQHPNMIQDDVWVLHPGREVELVARLLGRLEGYVVAPDGSPVPGARLVMVPPPDDDDPFGVSPFVSRHAGSDAEGYFFFSRIERPPCDPCGEAAGRCDPAAPAGLPTRTQMVVTARAPGHRLAELRIDDAYATGPITVQLAAPAAPVEGRLVDGAGQPYLRARVLATAQGRPHDRVAAAVDPVTGSFTLVDLGEGPYDLRAVQDGRELATRGAVVPGDAVTLTGAPTATGPSLVLTVLDAQGAPVPGMQIMGGPFAGAITDAEGRVRAEQVGPGPYRLHLRRASGPAVRREVTVPEGEGAVALTITLGDRGLLE